MTVSFVKEEEFDTLMGILTDPSVVVVTQAVVEQVMSEAHANEEEAQMIIRGEIDKLGDPHGGDPDHTIEIASCIHSYSLRATAHKNFDDLFCEHVIGGSVR